MVYRGAGSGHGARRGRHQLDVKGEPRASLSAMQAQAQKSTSEQSGGPCSKGGLKGCEDPGEGAVLTVLDPFPSSVFPSPFWLPFMNSRASCLVVRIPEAH